jgi:hypothetical protein
MTGLQSQRSMKKRLYANPLFAVSYGSFLAVNEEGTAFWGGHPGGRFRLKLDSYLLDFLSSSRPEPIKGDVVPFKLTTRIRRIRNQLDFLSWEHILHSSLSRRIPVVLRSCQSPRSESSVRRSDQPLY